MLNKKKKRGRKKLKNPLNSELSSLYLNFSVINLDKKEIGKVVSVINYGASDILIFKNTENKELMIPLTDNAVLRINNDSKEIVINEEYST